MENKNALLEIYKGAAMGLHAINVIIEKVEGEDLKKELQNEKNKYDDILERIEDVYPKYGDDVLKRPSITDKMMLWGEISISSLVNNDDTHYVEMMLNGVNMGIEEGVKILNHKKLDKEVLKICNKFVSMQEKFVDNLKKFL